MMKSLSMCAMILGVLFVRFARACWTRSFVVASGLARKIFLPTRESRFPTGKKPSDRGGRLHYFAWLSTRQLRLARRFGLSARELLSQGRNASARNVAWGAYLHWRLARKADRKFEAEVKLARHRVVA